MKRNIKAIIAAFFLALPLASWAGLGAESKQNYNKSLSFKNSVRTATV